MLVTGGTGGVGGHVARWPPRRAPQRLVLASRRGPDAPGARTWPATGGRHPGVDVVACDVADRDAVAGAARPIGERPTARCDPRRRASAQVPLRPDHGPDDFAECWPGQGAGAVHLDELIADRPLDAFVLFSSVAAVWGSGGQAGVRGGERVPGRAGAAARGPGPAGHIGGLGRWGAAAAWPAGRSARDLTGSASA